MPESTSKHKRYTHVRLLQTTKDRLTEELNRLCDAIEAGHTPDIGTNADPINPLAKALSMDQLINRLLDERQAHRERSRKSKRKSKGDGTESVS